MRLPDATRTLALSIAGIRFRFSGLPATLDAALRSRFDLFVVPDEPEAANDLDVELSASPVRQYLPYPHEGGPIEYQVESETLGGRLHAWSYSFSGCFDIEGNRGELELCLTDFEPPHRSVENFLRVALAWKAMNHGGFLLHASGVVVGGRAYLFFGPSGSGKTTITRLSEGSLVLNDDCILLMRTSGPFRASGVPFKGAEDAGAQNSGSFPIAGLFRLVKAPTPSCERLPPARAASELLSSIPFVTDRKEGFDRVFNAVEEVLRSAPVYSLRFRLSPDFWSCIERETGS